MAKMTPEEYEQKRLARIERLRAAADRKQREGQSRLDKADEMASYIPFGQPILVGHHSEKRDRRYREKIHDNMRKGLDLKDEAQRLRDRAEAAEQNNAIFTDDPQATEKLEAKLERLVKRQELMKAANKLVRKQDRDGLLDMGFSEKTIDALFTPDFCGRLGFPDYEIKNNGANIRRIKQRIEHLERHADDETQELVIGKCKIVDNVDANRLQIFFPGKPSIKCRKELKQSGFRWANSEGAWQRHRSGTAIMFAKRIVSKYYGEE